MSATAGKVALRTTTTALTCSTGCATQSGVRDFIGYGSSASSFEGAAPAPGLSNTTSAQRAGGGATDTDANSADFTAAAPTPQNSSGGGGGGPRIRDIQGQAHISPMNGQQPAAVPGIVTAVSTTGFWMQDPTPDANVATSEGIFVYTASAPGRSVGDSVTVTGTVSEFRPGGTGGTKNLTTTELTSPTVTLVATGVALPATTVVGSGGRVPPASVIDNDATGDVATNSSIVAADQILYKLVAAITAAGGPAYSWRQINPTDDADGGEPGGNIRVVFLFRTDRGLGFVDRPGGTATATTTVSNVGGQPQLSSSPGRVAPTDSAWSASRKPLAGEFTWNGQTIFAIANHFNSKAATTRSSVTFSRRCAPRKRSATSRRPCCAGSWTRSWR